MKVKFTRRSLELTPEQWQALERLATETGSIPPTRRQASWRTLIKRIADGDLVVKEAQDK
jgi:hypothetical protein